LHAQLQSLPLTVTGDPTVIVDLGSIPDQMKKYFCRENVGPVEIDVQASSFDIDLSRRPAHLCAASS
jgi:hypothetical protein